VMVSECESVAEEEKDHGKTVDHCEDNSVPHREEVSYRTRKSLAKPKKLRVKSNADPRDQPSNGNEVIHLRP
jgi:hypothetical protein